MIVLLVLSPSISHHRSARNDLLEPALHPAYPTTVSLKTIFNSIFCPTRLTRSTRRTSPTSVISPTSPARRTHLSHLSRSMRPRPHNKVLRRVPLPRMPVVVVVQRVPLPQPPVLTHEQEHPQLPVHVEAYRLDVLALLRPRVRVIYTTEKTRDVRVVVRRDDEAAGRSPRAQQVHEAVALVDQVLAKEVDLPDVLAEKRTVGDPPIAHLGRGEQVYGCAGAQLSAEGI